MDHFAQSIYLKKYLTYLQQNLHLRFLQRALRLKSEVTIILDGGNLLPSLLTQDHRN
jgi:hypothetical protein